MSLTYVCNVHSDHDAAEEALPVPEWDFDGDARASLHNAARQPFKKRLNGQDVSDDGRDDDNASDPVPTRRGMPSLDGEGDSSDGGAEEEPEEPLLVPDVKFGVKRRSSGQDVNHDLPRRTPADLLADETDLSDDGSEQGVLGASPWTQEMFRKRGRK